MKNKKNKSGRDGKHRPPKNKFKKGNSKSNMKNKKELLNNLLKSKMIEKKKPKGSYKYSAKKLQDKSLKDRMLEKLKASRFRYMNEQLYNMNSREALRYFKQDKDAFTAYHNGYKQQVELWPINPLDVVIESLKKTIKKGQVIADFGCGEAKLAKSLPQATVHSFDLVALDPIVTVCDMASTPLQDSSVHVAVFCLSLMGTNFTDYLIEANRVLKEGGILKIAEVESRFENLDAFVNSMSKFGFENTSNNFSNQLFQFLDFKKTRNIGKSNKKKLAILTLKPCLYKKR